jgi:hypothetical protein
MFTHRIPAAVLDTGLSSLATFVVGVYATRALSVEVLGGYALVFTVVLLGGLVPTLLAFTPAEIEAAVAHPSRRLRILRVSLPLGGGEGLIAAGGVALWLPFARQFSPEVVLGLTLTGMATALLSPLQDHVRRLLHSAERSWAAVRVSALHLAAAVGSILLLSGMDVDRPWIPLGSLAIANLLSLLAGLLEALPSIRRKSDLELPRISMLTRTGSWLLLIEAVPAAAGFMVAALVAHYAGAAALGHAEAARVVGQPVLVLAVGLSAVLAPRLFLAARQRKNASAHRSARVFTMVITLVGVGYLGLVGPGWHWNPIRSLVPSAYEVRGLAVATIAANIAFVAAYPLRHQMVGAGLKRGLLRIELAGNALRGLVAMGAAVLQSFALPAGLLLLGLTRAAAYRPALRSYYATHCPEDLSADIHAKGLL